MAKKIAWQMFVQTGLLLLFYAAASLFLSAKFLPTDPLASSLSFMQLSALQHILLDAALLTGILAAAVHFLLEDESPLLLWAYRAWTLFLLIVGISGLMGYYEGRHMLELPFYLDIVQLVLLAFWFVIFLGGKANLAKEIFLAALAFLGLAYAFSLVPIQSPLYDRILRVLMVNGRYFIAYPLAACAIAYWLKPEIQVHTIAAATIALGSLASIAPLTATGALWATGIVIAPVIFLLSLFLARMSSAKDNWGNLARLLFLVSLGVLGAAFAVPALGMHLVGTQLSSVQLDLAAWAVIALILSLMTSISEDNAQGIRFWLTAGGLVTAFLALAIAGIVQSFMERVLSIGYLDTQSTIVALYMLWMLGLMLAGLGILLHNLYWVRRPL